jgi:hypothetical protein
MRQADCAECTRLWKALTEVTMEHSKAKSKLDIATYSYDTAAIARLAVPVEQAASRKLKAEQALRQHEQQAHPETREATSDSAAPSIMTRKGAL